jgi:hypothetical protein
MALTQLVFLFYNVGVRYQIKRDFSANMLFCPRRTVGLVLPLLSWWSAFPFPRSSTSQMSSGHTCQPYAIRCKITLNTFWVLPFIHPAERLLWRWCEPCSLRKPAAR